MKKFISKLVKFIKKNEDGQTAVEYILLTVVMAALSMTVMKKFQAALSADCGVQVEVIGRSLKCRFQTMYGVPDNETGFTYFTMIK